VGLRLAQTRHPSRPPHWAGEQPHEGDQQAVNAQRQLEAVVGASAWMASPLPAVGPLVTSPAATGRDCAACHRLRLRGARTRKTAPSSPRRALSRLAVIQMAPIAGIGLEHSPHRAPTWCWRWWPMPSVEHTAQLMGWAVAQIGANRELIQFPRTHCWRPPWPPPCDPDSRKAGQSVNHSLHQPQVIEQGRGDCGKRSQLGRPETRSTRLPILPQDASAKPKLAPVRARRQQRHHRPLARVTTPRRMAAGTEQTEPHLRSQAPPRSGTAGNQSPPISARTTRPPQQQGDPQASSQLVMPEHGPFAFMLVRRQLTESASTAWSG